MAGFNLTGAGQELSSAGVGMVVADINGDGRSDILRWKDVPAQTALYLSNGDGSFTSSTTFPLFFNTTTQLKKSDGSTEFVTGDFTGRGTTEFLRVKASPTAGDATSNQLYVKADTTPPDQLISVTTGAAATTTLYYVPLSNSTPNNGVSASYGARYTSDRGTTNAASGNTLDLTFPMYVAATSKVDSGVGSKTVNTEYSYIGLKADITGRGLLGFREVRRQNPGPNGNPLTVDTQYLGVHPYIGVALRTDTYNSALNATSTANLLSSTFNTYCDQIAPTTASDAALASAVAGAQASPPQGGTSCPSTAKASAGQVQRPYLLWSTETGKDLIGTNLPSVTTQNTFNGAGDPTSIVVTTTGVGAGLSQTFTKTTTNQYQADNTAGDNWVLGRLARASVQSTVPNSLAGITISPGNGAYATATSGTEPTQAAVITPSLSFGSVNVGVNLTKTVTLANDGAAALNITVPSAASVTGSDFSFVSTTCGSSLAAGTSCTIDVRFTPTTAASRTGTLSIATGAGARASSLSGVGLQAVLGLSSASLAYGNVTVNTSANSGSITLTNNGNTAATGLAITVAPGYGLLSNTCGATLNPTSSCTFIVQFSPTAMQSYPGTLSATASGAAPASASLSGAGGASTVTVTSTSALTATGTVTFTNSGNQTATLTMSGLSGAYSVSPASCTAAASGGTCVVTVTMSTGGAIGVQGAQTLTATGGTSSASASVSGTVTGSSATLTSGTALNFGAVGTGTAAPQAAWTFRNDGNSAMTLSLSALNSPFTLVSNGCTSVAPGSPCSITAQMGTGTAGSYGQSSIGISGAAQGSRSDLSLAGSVVAQTGTLSISPTSVALSASGGLDKISGTITLTNAGPGSVSGLSLSFVRTYGTVGEISLNTDLCIGHTLASGGTCTFTLDFASSCPNAATSRWNLTITGAGAASTVVLPITGTTTSGICR